MSTSIRPTKHDFVELLRLASPIVSIQLGLVAMGTVDTLMVGQYSAVALGGVALGNLYSFGWSIFGMGTLLALDPLVGQAIGAGDYAAVRRSVQRGLLLAACLTVPTTLAYLSVGPVLRLVGQPDELVPIAAGYVYRTAPALFPFYVFIVLRQSLQAHRRTTAIVAAIVISNGINAGLNYLWVFGHGGFPALGAFGSAWATMASRWSTALLLLGFSWRHLAPWLTQLAARVFAVRPLWRMILIGAPIGGQMVLEWGVIATIALLMGWLGTSYVAAHQIALALASVTYMVPLGVSVAAGVLVAQAVGRGDMPAMRRAGVAGLTVGVGFMALAGIGFIAAPGLLADPFTDDSIVLQLAVTLLPIAGVFQIFDGTQVVALGVLRGIGDTRIPVLASIVGYWCLGLPASLWLAFRTNAGAAGLWWGLVVGLGIVALFLALRLYALGRRSHERLLIDY
ncbi:MAG: MATE family efflux transporter [Gammaproteobacteria bacterium]